MNHALLLEGRQIYNRIGEEKKTNKKNFLFFFSVVFTVLFYKNRMGHKISFSQWEKNKQNNGTWFLRVCVNARMEENKIKR
jgi:hypothetical protein